MPRAVHMYRTMQMTKKDLEGSMLSPQVDLETLHNEEVKTKAELLTAWQSVKSVSQQTHKDSWQRLRNF